MNYCYPNYYNCNPRYMDNGRGYLFALLLVLFILLVIIGKTN
ncbi:YjcZ family sporulation protein [Mycoplasmatota bacterium]|nr:YjcZ family sporulation protein [Mycoplasmatota bacterium]